MRWDCLKYSSPTWKEGFRMAIVITNGTYYVQRNIDHTNHRIHKTQNIAEAKQYYNVNVAQNKIFSAPGQLKGYYVFDTDGDEKPTQSGKPKRKKYTYEERKFVYERENCKCALCGKKITLSQMTLDHITPLDCGGEDCLENLQPACYACNQFKGNIRPEDFVEKIIEIFMYQIEKKMGNTWKWKMLNRLLQGII